MNRRSDQSDRKFQRVTEQIRLTVNPVPSSERNGTHFSNPYLFQQSQTIGSAFQACAAGKSLAVRMLSSGAVGTEARDHDVRDDETLPDLQAAIDEESAHGNRTVRLRQTRLARLINAPGSSTYVGVQQTTN